MEEVDDFRCDLFSEYLIQLYDDTAKLFVFLHIPKQVFPLGRGKQLISADDCFKPRGLLDTALPSSGELEEGIVLKERFNLIALDETGAEVIQDSLLDEFRIGEVESSIHAIFEGGGEGFEGEIEGSGCGGLEEILAGGEGSGIGLLEVGREGAVLLHLLEFQVKHGL